MMTKRNIYTKLKYLVCTIALLPMVAQSQVDTNIYKEDLKYLESSFTRNYDSLLTSYFNKKNSHHISTKHYKHGSESFDDLMFDDIPDSVLFKRLNSIPAVIPMTYNGVVRSYIKMYVRRMTNNLNNMLSLSEYYFPFFEQALERHNMPLELKYLPIIESALNPQAVSRVGATGLWQFMHGTAKIYGLNINSLIDERKDPLKASDAAARYLKDLYGIFGNWHLAIAAYNCGPKNITKAIARSGGKQDFWDIYRYLPKETRGYIPAYIAATYVMTNYEKHNLRPTAIDIPLETDTLVINKALLDVAKALKDHREYIKSENAKDIENARAKGLSEAFIDRLLLTDKVIDGMAEGLVQVANLTSPVGRVEYSYKNEEQGIVIEKKAVPFGTTFSFLGWVMGFEPTNTGTTIRGLRPLGDTHHIQFADQ